MATEKNPEGPSLREYLETRLNLLNVYVDKLERALRERIDAVEEASVARKMHLESEIAHAKELLQKAQEEAKRAIDKAQAAQDAHNAASNEWRGALNDFKITLVPRTEFDRLDRDFAAFKLASSERSSQQFGEKTATRESKESNMATLAIIAAAVSALVGIIMPIVLAALRGTGRA